MGEASARLGLPFLAVGQAQKEVTHNEALALIDLALHAGVEAVGANAPPPAPLDGQAWIVGPAPAGTWTGRAQALAGWTGGGWRFVPAREGMVVLVRGSGLTARFAGGAWIVGELACRRVTVDGLAVLGARRPAIAAPMGGSTTDQEARTVVSAILDALRGHGLIAS